MSDDVKICSHGRGLNWPQEIWVGVSDDTWSIRAFSLAEHAADWVGGDPRVRHAYKVDGTITAEIRHVPPVPASHEVIPVTATQAGGPDA